MIPGGVGCGWVVWGGLLGVSGGWLDAWGWSVGGLAVMLGQADAWGWMFLVVMAGVVVVRRVGGWL